MKALKSQQALLLIKLCSSATDLAILEQQATALALHNDVSVQEYVRKNRAQCSNVYSAKYPNIEREGTTIRFMIEVMRYNS